MSTLHLECPFCGQAMDVDHDGSYAPRYARCASCNERFIYEPLRDGVRTLRPSEADSCSDPEQRELETGGSCED
ncbi:hypothetical protein SAMN02745704_01469 [Paucidesulfovibrio gracilis DSM 16080]|uniref:Uncharacterized protein n=1 Tax=Paucidesulfovibrio gracilis DSM 16080 TaxID=1121449 RepID=A0A1T4WX75_9BACT|nr:hypothetical protein [Paucidesulfovibrio gracilis]SKA81904.1 hypothetical protein SAMN02745704_01469 [Paucidesulfovibrio gracilis DSM 16080]